MRQRRTHISLKIRTKETLDSIRAQGQSYDGIIQELIGQWWQNHFPKDVAEENRASRKRRNLYLSKRTNFVAARGNGKVIYETKPSNQDGN